MRAAGGSERKESVVSAPEEPMFGALGTLPVACAVVTAILCLYMLLVAVGNVTDYETNFAYVRHVMAMDTTNFGAAPDADLDRRITWRAIDSPTLQNAAYLIIIIWESLTAIVLVFAFIHWLMAFRRREFVAARRWSSLGFLMIVTLFMGGFIAIGGEWFQMWRSTEWNGLEAAFRNAVLALFGLILVHLPSPHWATMVSSADRGEGQ